MDLPSLLYFCTSISQQRSSIAVAALVCVHARISKKYNKYNKYTQNLRDRREVEPRVNAQIRRPKKTEVTLEDFDLVDSEEDEEDGGGDGGGGDHGAEHNKAW